MQLPNFLIIGAAKSGTTSLYHYLGQHPDVYLCPIKETHYFISGNKPLNFTGPLEQYTVCREAVTSWAEYRLLFDRVTGEKAIGEVCPSYLRTAGAARRISDRLPGVKLIAVLRNPVDRAYSDYLMCRGLGVEKQNFEEALEEEPRRIAEHWYGGIYMSKGYYGRQLAAYYELFPAEQILVFRYEDLCRDSQAVMNKICSFIGVDPRDDWDLTERHNVSGEIANPLLRKLWVGSGRLRGQLRPLLPQFVRQYTSRTINKVQRKRTVMAEGTRRKLTNLYHDDIIRCAELTGLDLQTWLLEPEDIIEGVDT
jgi:Sulfotransferase family